MGYVLCAAAIAKIVGSFTIAVWDGIVLQHEELLMRYPDKRVRDRQRIWE